MLQGSQIGEYSILGKLGQGSYGQIFTVRSQKTNQVYAAKVEPLHGQRKTIEFESRVLQSVGNSMYFPKYVMNGRNAHFSYLVMDLLGPSLSHWVKRMHPHKLSLSSGLRVAFHMLKALEVLHQSGFIHRDIKPANVVVRQKCPENPIAIIDFGLARAYIDGATQRHLPARSHPGFRGTALYASVNAHLEMDLSRRDDLISWYYVCIDLLTGDLPWKNVETTDEILRLKRTMRISTLLHPLVPEMSEVWHLISHLSYKEKPDYERIYALLNEAIVASEVDMNECYDWDCGHSVRKSSSDPSDLSGDPYLKSQGSERNGPAKAGDDSLRYLSHTNGCCNVC